MNMWRKNLRGSRQVVFAIAASVVAFGLMAPPSAHAALLGLTPNQTIDFTVTPAVDTLGLPTGPQVFSESSSYGTANWVNVGGAILQGTLNSWVYQDTPSSSTLDFVYQLINTGSGDSFKELTLSRFSTFMTNVGYKQTAATDPTAVDRNGTNVIDWFFANASGIAPGQSSDLLVIQTDATNYHIGTGSIIDGGTAVAQVQVPFAGNGVPEPGSVSLIIVAAGLALGRRRRHA